MTSRQMEQAPPADQAVAIPSRVGQGTAIEQARAMAEVHAAMLIAREMPRDISTAIREMELSCTQLALADRAAYKFPRGGQTLTGPSVHLARELARAWGNIQYGITELRRDDDYGQSEMQAWAWDVQTNARSSSTFIVPHMRDKKGGAERLIDMRDIYENNANNGARRLREAIFSVLPVWFVEQAKNLCAKTLQDGGGTPLPTRIADAIKAYDARGISKAQLERKIGKPSNDWNAFDVADLRVTFQSLQRGEITIADEFPQERVTAAEVLKGQSAGHSNQVTNEEAPVAPPLDESEAEIVDEPRMIDRGMQRGMFKLFNDLGITDDTERLHITEAIVGRVPKDQDGKPSSNGLTAQEAATLTAALGRCKNRDQVEALVQMAEEQRAEAGEQS